MKKISMVLIVLTILCAGCEEEECYQNCDNQNDGDTLEGDIDRDYMEYDLTEIESEKEPAFSCDGSCENDNDTKCLDDDLCFCDNGVWKVYSCAAVCSSENSISSGCGPNSDMGGQDYCICECSGCLDGDEDLEPEPICTGPCDENFELECTGSNTLCTCNEETLQQEEVNCTDICIDFGPNCGADGCSSSDDHDVCYCYCTECQSDADCAYEGKDYCISLNNTTLCVDACEMNTCPGTNDKVGCMDVGFGDGCGICWDLENAESCENNGQCCGDNRVCNDVCGIYPEKPKCMQMCDAAPNTCKANETCMPLVTDEEGTIGAGFCIAWSDLNCDTCGEHMADGDEDSESDWEPEVIDCQPDGDEEIGEAEKADIESEIDTDE